MQSRPSENGICIRMDREGRSRVMNMDTARLSGMIMNEEEKQTSFRAGDGVIMVVISQDMDLQNCILYYYI